MTSYEKKNVSQSMITVDHSLNNWNLKFATTIYECIKHFEGIMYKKKSPL